MTVFSKTDVGLTRPVNQDSIFVSEGPLGPLPNLFVVADGLGGHAGGEVASRLAVEFFREYLAGCAGRGEGCLDLMAEAASVANNRVFETARNDPALFSMGTTFTACVIFGGMCEIIHIGDSRVYEIVGFNIKQLSVDHTYVNEMVRSGQLTPEEAKEHPKRNMLMRALGTSPDARADGYVHKLAPSGVVLLCSDGLTSMLDDIEIAALVTAREPANSLVKAANERGGYDNISVIVIKT
jgi:protein phosphatase